MTNKQYCQSCILLVRYILHFSPYFEVLGSNSRSETAYPDRSSRGFPQFNSAITSSCSSQFSHRPPFQRYYILHVQLGNCMFEFPCIITLYYIKNQQDATLAVLFISNCKITLHVSDAFCVHHQEY